MNDMKVLNVDKMNNYSVSEGKEIENLVFFYYCCQTYWVEDESFGRYLDTINVKCFETYEEAKNYIDNLENEDGWIKRIDEFSIEDNDLDSLNVYNSVYTEDDCIYEDDSFCFSIEYSFED